MLKITCAFALGVLKLRGNKQLSCHFCQEETSMQSQNAHNKMTMTNESGISQESSAGSPTSFDSVQKGGLTVSNHCGNIDIEESVKNHIFPVAKFLQLEDSPHTDESSNDSWCQKMANWCDILESHVPMWWGPARKIITDELGLQRSTKSDKIKAEFLVSNLQFHVFLCHC